MMTFSWIRGVITGTIITAVIAWPFSAAANDLASANEKLLEDIARVHQVDEQRLAEIRAIFARAPYLGQGNPKITVHPATPQECQVKLEQRGVQYENERDELICGRPYMAPLYAPATEQPEQATTCIDRFEFPNIPCAYPVVWVRAKEAAQICSAMGKYLCDAHEWEGACAGSLEPPDYPFDQVSAAAGGAGVKRMRSLHNQKHQATKSWSYGPAYQKGICAAASQKSTQCQGGGWQTCGSNTYPTGMFPDCRSPLGVYDIHGNAAEHMNLPLSEAQMASRGSSALGHTEMKGSWFIFDRYYAHEDWCRWRAPYWHGSPVMSADSHHNYHLGFRCCSKAANDGEND